MKLLVGLGNPGKQYENTRHNVGFEVIQELARELGASGRIESKLQAIVGEGRLDGEKVILAQPMTFMNLSGEAVSKILHWYKLTPKDMVVIYDDFAIPLGTVRVRPDGSPGGHNGIKSIIQHVGNPNWDRVKVGIGPVPPGWKTPDFVLGRFAPGEKALVAEAVKTAAEAAVCVVRHGAEKAMQTYNGLKPAT